MHKRSYHVSWLRDQEGLLGVGDGDGTIKTMLLVWLANLQVRGCMQLAQAQLAMLMAAGSGGTAGGGAFLSSNLEDHRVGGPVGW